MAQQPSNNVYAQVMPRDQPAASDRRTGSVSAYDTDNYSEPPVIYSQVQAAHDCDLSDLYAKVQR